MKRPVIGITAGDPAGIGPEICLKALSHPATYMKAIPVVFADTAVLEDAKKLTGKNLVLNAVNNPETAKGDFGTVDYVNTGFIKESGYSYGEVHTTSGEASIRYIISAIEAALAGKISAVVTGPINKEAINLAGHHFAGHTEIFAHYTDTKDYGMLLSGGGLNVIHVTTHVSMREACDLITKEQVFRIICMADTALRLMGKDKRRIGVAGFNPHASENGLFGDQEEIAIIPAIEQAKSCDLDVTGPVPPDTVFVKALGGKFDIVVAMYHDQGHIPLKLCGFKMEKTTGLFTHVNGINTTIGLPIIRTSVDHGTAFDIAGKNKASEESLLDAINMAFTFTENWKKVYKG